MPCRTSHRGHTHTPAHPHWLHARAARQPGHAMHRAGGVACMHAGCSWRADHAHACPAVAPTPAAGAHLAHATITRCSTRTPTRSGHCSARARSMHDVWARNVFGCRRLPCPSLPGACKHRHSTTPSPPPPVDADAGAQSCTALTCLVLASAPRTPTMHGLVVAESPGQRAHACCHPCAALTRTRSPCAVRRRLRHLGHFKQ